jgi:hypothetical protein
MNNSIIAYMAHPCHIELVLVPEAVKVVKAAENQVAKAL